MTFFLMICEHHDAPDIADRRDTLRPQHRGWVASGGDGLAVVLTGSAIWDDNGNGTGNFGILQAESAEHARAFAEGDPFAQGGIVRKITLTRLADSFRADRITPLTQS